MADEEELLAFIGNSFRSVWALEVLRFLVEHREEAHSADELIRELRVSNSVIAQSVDQLEAASLVVPNGPGALRFQPSNERLELLVLGALALYDRRPDQVRRTIVSRTSPGLTAFSDAFKLRKD